jgi:Ca2+-binding EF-hand superfamily protein
MRKISATLLVMLMFGTSAMPASAQLGGAGWGDRGDWFAKADANHDGVVTRAEFAGYRNGNFDQLDRNHDGAVSPADFPRLARLRPDAYARLTEMLGRADANGDGAISRTELAQSPPLMFMLADANDDGKVTKAEYEAAREQARAARAERKR